MSKLLHIYLTGWSGEGKQQKPTWNLFVTNRRGCHDDDLTVCVGLGFRRPLGVGGHIVQEVSVQQQFLLRRSYSPPPLPWRGTLRWRLVVAATAVTNPVVCVRQSTGLRLCFRPRRVTMSVTVASNDTVFVGCRDSATAARRRSVATDTRRGFVIGVGDRCHRRSRSRGWGRKSFVEILWSQPRLLSAKVVRAGKFMTLRWHKPWNILTYARHILVKTFCMGHSFMQRPVHP